MTSYAIKAGCTGKKVFTRFALAEKSAKRRNRQDGGAHVQPYHCRVCDQFHVGENRQYGKTNNRQDFGASRYE